MPTTEAKAQVIEDFRLADGDTGSPEVQVALLTARIKELTEHLKQHRKDFHSRLGLVKLVAKRKRLLAYLKRVDLERFLKLVKRLEIRH